MKRNDKMRPFPHQYTQIGDAVTFGTIPMERFQSSLLAVSLIVPLSRETVTENALVSLMLGKSTRDYPTYRLFSRKLGLLYGAVAGTSVQKLGDEESITFAASVVDNSLALAGEDLLTESAQLLLSMIFRPLIEDGAFDLVLNLGPMYHLFNQYDKEKAVRETLRVAKKGGICMFAYIPCAAIMLGYGLCHLEAEHLKELMDEIGRFKDVPEEVFSCFNIEDFKKLFDNTNTEYITNVATDGIAYAMKEQLEQLSDEGYQTFLKWHFLTCERLDQQGYSSHLLYVCKKK